MKNKKKILNVRKTDVFQVTRMRQMVIPEKYHSGEIFVRCNKNSFINWEVAPLFTKAELEERGNYEVKELIAR